MNTIDNDELNTLPNGAIIKTDHGIYMRNKPSLFPDQWCWLKQGNVDEYPRIYLRRPAEILYNPDLPEDPATDEEDARAELAKLLGKHYGTSKAGNDYLWAMADIIMGKGWAKHRAIKEVADLDALAIGSVVLDADGDPWKKRKNGQWLGVTGELGPAENVYWVDSEQRPTVLHEAVPGYNTTR